MRMVLSREGEARYWPSGDQAMRLIESVCPRKTWRRVSPGTGEPPISVKSFGCSSVSGVGSVFFLRGSLSSALIFLLRNRASQQVVNEIPADIVQQFLLICHSERSDTCAARQCSENPRDYSRDPSPLLRSGSG